MQAGPRVELKAVRFSGAQGLVSDPELAAWVQPYIGKSLSLGELNEMAQQVTARLADRGWVLARAFLPPQDITSGAVEVAIQRGQLSAGPEGNRFRLDTPESLVRAGTRLSKIVNSALQISDAQPDLQEARLQRAVLLIQDIPGLQAKANLEKGEAAGSTLLTLQVSQLPRVQGQVSLDNLGNRYTGVASTAAQVGVQDALLFGDQVTTVLSAAQGIRLAALNYSWLLGDHGLRATLGASRLQYKVGEELAELDSNGRAATLQLGLSYPLLRTRDRTLRLQAGAETKALTDFALGNMVKDRRVQLAFFGLGLESIDTWWSGGFNNLQIKWTQGNADFSRVQADAEAGDITQTAGAFGKLGFVGSRQQRLSESSTLLIGGSAQWSNRNLPSSERFSIGGAAGVRAYPGGEGSGDVGATLSIEGRRDLLLRGLSQPIKLSAFYDVGWIRVSNDTQANPTFNATGRNQYHLAGVGLGVGYDWAQVASLKVQWATRIGDNPGRGAQTDADSDGRRVRHRFMVSVSRPFSAF